MPTPPGRHERPPGWRDRLKIDRYPFIYMLFVCAAFGGGAAWQSLRVAATRRTVPHGWATGIVAGVGACIFLTAIALAFWTAAKHAPKRVRRPMGITAFATMICIFCAFLVAIATTIPSRFSTTPYIATTEIAVAQMSYAAACIALLFIALVIVTLRAIVHRDILVFRRPRV